MPILPILLEDGYVPVIQQGDTIRIGQLLASRTRPAELTVSIAEVLEIPPNKVPKYLLKNPGDSVKAGDELAATKNIWGKPQAAVVCKVAGIVSRFERETGVMAIRPEGKSDTEDTLISPIEGVVSLCNNEKILIETTKHFVLGNRGSGDQTTEKLLFVHENDSDAVQTYELDADTIGNIVVGKYFPRELLIKGVSMGITGFIGSKFLDDDLLYLQEKKVTIPVIEIADEDLPKLKHWHGKRAYMHGEGKTIILLQT